MQGIINDKSSNVDTGISKRDVQASGKTGKPCLPEIASGNLFACLRNK